MTLISLSLVLASTALVACALPALAQDKSGGNVDPSATPAPAGGATTMGLAQDLYALGVKQGDALTVLAAARLAASVEVITADAAPLDPATISFDGDQESLRKTAVPATVPAAPAPMMANGIRPAAKATFFTSTSAEEGAADGPANAEAMFAKARELAGGDAVILGLIEGALAEDPRVRIGEAVSWLSRLPAGQTDVWKVPFYGKSYAEIAVVGDGDTNLDVTIIDENGNVFCYDVGGSDSLSCDFTPAWDGYFYVTVQNTGGVRNSYYLMTN